MERYEKYFYTENHEWVEVEEDEAVIGISDYAQEEMGDIVYVELPEPGEEIEQFEELATIESVKAVSDVFAPLSGEILEINENIVEQPELVNESPYEEGWMVKIKISDKTEMEELMDSSEYDIYLEEIE